MAKNTTGQKNRLEKMAQKGFCGYPIATVAFYGPNSKFVISDGIMGCPHEEGIDYPEGESCPNCPYWENRDRFLDEVIQ